MGDVVSLILVLLARYVASFTTSLQLYLVDLFRVIANGGHGRDVMC